MAWDGEAVCIVNARRAQETEYLYMLPDYLPHRRMIQVEVLRQTVGLACKR
jgi:hypothetical protein